MSNEKPKTQLAFTARHKATDLATVHKFLTHEGHVISSRNGTNAAGFDYLARLVAAHLPHLVVRDLNEATAYLRDVGLTGDSYKNREGRRLVKSLAIESETMTTVPESGAQLGEQRMDDVAGVLGDVSGLGGVDED